VDHGMKGLQQKPGMGLLYTAQMRQKRQKRQN
jgi:hypothetical protein